METSYEPGGPHDELFEGQGIGLDDDSDRSSQDARYRYSQDGQRQLITPPSSPPDSPRQKPDFAPRGTVKLRTSFRDKIPASLSVSIPDFSTPIADAVKNISLDRIQNASMPMVTPKAQNKQIRKSLEHIKFLVNSSQIWEEKHVFGLSLPASASTPKSAVPSPYPQPWNTNGVIAAASAGFFVAGLARWFLVGGFVAISLKRIIVTAVLIVAAVRQVKKYTRRQWLEYLHQQAIAEAERFMSNSSEFDQVIGSAVSFVMEVELISRGYRLSLPVPPVSRMENADQRLRSRGMRKALIENLTPVIKQYYQGAREIREFPDPAELKMNDDTKQLDPVQIEQAMTEFLNMDPSSKDAQKTAHLQKAYRLSRDTRKLFLVGLMSITTQGKRPDLLRFTKTLQALRDCNRETIAACYRMKSILSGDADYAKLESTAPMSPRHGRWKVQIQRVADMTMTIRGLQAKMAILLDESTVALDKADDISELGPLFLSQYDSVGKDLKDLMESWEIDKKNLIRTIADNQRRKSGNSQWSGSPGPLLISSPTPAQSPETIASPISLTEPVEMASILEDNDEGMGPEDAIRRLDGEIPLRSEVMGGSPITPEALKAKLEESYEAIATPRPKSMLSRRERLEKMQEERAAKEAARDRALQQNRIMGELRDVLKSRSLYSPSSSAAEQPGPLPPVS
ncbi:Mysoin-binding motif of peroxisomes-domain-containing protein [Xylariales sp. PMI_506]|nr:Mysoin-binding motif of peroxisomes-domain-containing protein [Xylariales sp. PMI_506]